MPDLEYCFAVWCLASNTHGKLLDCVVKEAHFTTGGVFECNMSHHCFVAVSCMMYETRCNPIHHLHDALSACAVCSSAGFTWCFCCTLVYLSIVMRFFLIYLFIEK